MLGQTALALISLGNRLFAWFLVRRFLWQPQACKAAVDRWAIDGREPPGFAWSTHFWLHCVLLTVVGFGQASRMSLSNVLIQSYVDDDFRGRVMSIYMLEMAFLSIAIYPISLFADYFGPQWAVGLSAMGLVLLILTLFQIPQYRDLD